MREVVILSAVRTPGGKANKGSFYDVRPETFGKLCIQEVLKRSRVYPEEIDDVIWGCAVPERYTGYKIARGTALHAGLPPLVSAVTVNRFCASGLQAISFGAESILSGRCDVVLAGGVEYMSANGGISVPDPDIIVTPETQDTYMAMGITAERVASRYEVTRTEQDMFALASHQKAAAAIAAGRFAQEIVPVPVTHVKLDKRGHRVYQENIVSVDEGVRGGTTLEQLAKLKPAFQKNGTVTAGNSSQRTDGAAAVLLMERSLAEERGLVPMARYVGFASAGCQPDEMGVGPVYAVPKVLQSTGLSLNDIGLIELNEAFASQSIYCIRELNMNPELVNVNGGAIALGHPMGATGAKLTATLLYEMERRKIRYGMVTMCIGGGQGAAAIYECYGA